jgi:hypothetical protein
MLLCPGCCPRSSCEWGPRESYDLIEAASDPLGRRRRSPFCETPTPRERDRQFESTLTGLYGRAARGPITGITLIAGFASTVGWPLSAFLDAQFGWREACLIWAALHIVIGLPLNRLLIPRAPPPARTSEVAEETSPAPRGAMAILAFVFAATWFVTGAMAAHLPRLLEIAGASSTAAIAAAALVGPAQVAARLVEFGALRMVHPLVSARLAALLHPIGAVILGLLGPHRARSFRRCRAASPLSNGKVSPLRSTRLNQLPANSSASAAAAPSSILWSSPCALPCRVEHAALLHAPRAKFAIDSLQERAGFEPSVPRSRLQEL